MKKIFLLSLVAVFFGNISAQTARNASFDINKGKTAQGYTIDFPASKSDKVVSDAFQEMLGRHGLKAGKSKVVNGFTNYVNQVLSPLASYRVSIYYKVASEGKKNDRVTRLYFVVLSDGENQIQSELLVTLEPRIFLFLNDFPVVLADYENNLKLKETQNLLEKLKKESDKLKKEREGLEKDLRNKETEMLNKEKEIQNAEAEIDRIQNQLRK